MKILFYLESFPIRNRFESFGFIGEKVLKMIQDDYLGKMHSMIEPDEVRILLSRYYSSIQNKYNDLKPAFLGMTKEENDTLDSYMREWNEESGAIVNWVSLMTGEGDVTLFYHSVLERIRTEVYAFDAIVYWSTNGAVKTYCEKHGLFSIAMEMGCLRAPFYDSLYIDASGVNGKAISRYINLDLVEDVSLIETRMLLPMFGRNGSGMEDALFEPIKSKYSKEIYSTQKKVLITLQLKDDSNCILYSPYSSMFEMLQEVIPLLKQAGFLCLVKPHPAAKDRAINLLDHEECKVYCENIDNVAWIDDIDHNLAYSSLLTKIDWVVTVNSSAGFEAMLFGKPVIILGDAPYKVRGVNHPTLMDIINNKNLDELYFTQCRKIVLFIIQYYLIPSAYGFNLDFFSKYIERAIRAEALYLTEGSTAMTKYLLSEVCLDHSIKNRILAKRALRERFKPHKKQLHISKDTPISSQSIAQKKMKKGFVNQKKFTKFKRDPAKFFIDSKNPFLHYLGKAMGGRV